MTKQSRQNCVAIFNIINKLLMIVTSQQKYGLLRSARNDDVFSIKTTTYSS
jgi:hypothetical protein